MSEAETNHSGRENEILADLADRFIMEWQQGKAPSVDDYARHHPELADEIRDVFPALELLERSGAPYAEVIGGTLSERIASIYGAETDPRLVLPESDEQQDDLSSEIVRRLADRGETYGRYQLKGEIARGGQGVVMRVWDEDLRRNLAMKVVLGKGDALGETPPVDPRTLGRFLEEAQITGQLDHPGIVPVHELGLDSQSRVYFTMKLVKGRDLKAIFDLVHGEREGWNQTRALNVMLKVCEAMAYAHSKGVIHRDLKPSNVMVGRYGEVYVMDWGLARILDREDRRDLRIRPEENTISFHTDRRDREDSPDSPLLTMDGDVVGTPAYMSPEQAAGNLQAMGPHSDVYSAGAMLYHLLTGHIPYVRPGMAATNYSIWHRVQEGPPTPLRELTPSVPSELDAICEKAMARDAGARYVDMQELAEDLRAFLEHRVVQAYETGAVAELRKWVARNKPLAVASAVAVLALVGGLVTSSSLFFEARDRAKEASDNALVAQTNEQQMREERDRADLNATEAERQADLARAEAQRATQEEATTERVLEFLTGMFEQQDPRESRGTTITVKEVLDRNAARIEQELANDPEIKARLMVSMASLYHSLGLFQEAEPLLKRALSLRRELLGVDHPDTLTSLNNLAMLYEEQGRYDESERLSILVLERRRAVLGEEHPSTLSSLTNLAALYASQGQYEKAEALYVQALEGCRSVLGVYHPLTLGSLSNLATLYVSQGRYEEAEPLTVQALEMRRAVLGEKHPDTLCSINNLATLYNFQGRYEQAEPLLVQVLEMYRAVLGVDHPGTLTSLNNLALLYEKQGRHEEAEPLLVQALEKKRAVLGEDHPSTLLSLNNLGLTYTSQRRYEKAEELFVLALEKYRAVLGQGHPDTLRPLLNLAMLYERQGRYEKAEPLFVQALVGYRAVLGEDHPLTLNTLNGLGLLCYQTGRPEDAEPFWVQALEMRRAVLGEDHPDTLISLSNLTVLYRGWLSSRRAALGANHPDTLTTQSKLGAVLWSQSSYGEAELLLIECLAKRTEILGENHPDTLTTLYHVARLHESLQHWEEAEIAAGSLLELTPGDAEEYTEREQLLERILEALNNGE